MVNMGIPFRSQEYKCQKYVVSVVSNRECHRIECECDATGSQSVTTIYRKCTIDMQHAVEELVHSMCGICKRRNCDEQLREADNVEFSTKWRGGKIESVSLMKEGG